MQQSTLCSVIASIFVVLFLYTGIQKLIDHQVFLAALKRAEFFGNTALFISWMIPVLELIIALCLFMPATRITGLYAAFVLMFIFTTYIAAMLIFKSHRPCSCGGVIATLTWPQHLAFNIVFLLLALLAIARSLKASRTTQVHINVK